MKNHYYPGDGMYVDLLAAYSRKAEVPFEAFGQLWVVSSHENNLCFSRIGPAELEIYAPGFDDTRPMIILSA